MKIKSRIAALLTFVCLIAYGNLAFADTAITRTPWQMHDGFDQFDSSGKVIPIAFEPSCLTIENNTKTASHGAVCEFDVAEIPDQDNSEWLPAPDPDTIAFGGPNASLLPSWACRKAGDFSYFQTFVEIPPGATVDTFTIQFNNMDDGSLVSICDGNSCSAVPGSHVQLNNGGTTDLSSLVSVGTNRVVITQVDDCATGNTLGSAIVTLNDETVQVPTDDDDDGVPNNLDACPNTNLEPTVTIFGVNSGVVNTISANGCSLSDSVDAIQADCGVETNHGKFVSCTAHGLNDLLQTGVITDAEKDALQSAAGRSSVGKPANSKGKK